MHPPRIVNLFYDQRNTYELRLRCTYLGIIIPDQYYDDRDYLITQLKNYDTQKTSKTYVSYERQTSTLRVSILR